jgi:hypothetical protein
MGAKAIRLTPEMIEAGARILEDFYDALPSAAEREAKLIFTAMLSAASPSIGVLPETGSADSRASSAPASRSPE